MTARRLERGGATPVGLLVRAPRTARSSRAYDLFWPLLGLNTVLQVVATLVGRPEWYSWLQAPVTLAMVVLGVRFLVLRVPEVRANRRSAAGDRP